MGVSVLAWAKRVKGYKTLVKSERVQNMGVSVQGMKGHETKVQDISGNGEKAQGIGTREQDMGTMVQDMGMGSTKHGCKTCMQG